MNKKQDFKELENSVQPIKWCNYMVKAGYATVGVIALAHIIWYFVARKLLISSPEDYLRYYIIYPTIILLTLNFAVDLIVNSDKVSLWIKEYTVLLLYSAFSFYLYISHKITTVLLGSFTLSVFASTIFANIKITKRIFWTNSIALIICGLRLYVAAKYDSRLLMEVFVAWNLLLCSYFLSKIFIRYGEANIVSLMHLYNRHESIQEQLKYDGFTGLYNRITFDEQVEIISKECKQKDLYLSIAIIDIDEFKKVNDMYGHAMGDRALINVAKLCKESQKENITAFRIGGDEFAILFKGYYADKAYDICEGIRKKVKYSSGSKLDNNSITVSCGVACISLKNTAPSELLKAADDALYSAKKAGKNRVFIYEGSGCKKNKI